MPKQPWAQVHALLNHVTTQGLRQVMEDQEVLLTLSQRPEESIALIALTSLCHHLRSDLRVA